MGTLAVDIETASPHEEPPPGSNETRYFEWLAVAVAYSEDEADETGADGTSSTGSWTGAGGETPSGRLPTTGRTWT
jgi:hypothetical protein